MTARERVDEVLAAAPGREQSLVLGDLFRVIADELDAMTIDQAGRAQAFALAFEDWVKEHGKVVYR